MCIRDSFASGGFGKVFKTTSNAHTLTGDGMAIVYRKGLPPVSYTHLRAHETVLDLVCRLLLEKKKKLNKLITSNLHLTTTYITTHLTPTTLSYMNKTTL